MKVKLYLESADELNLLTSALLFGEYPNELAGKSIWFFWKEKNFKINNFAITFPLVRRRDINFKK